MKEYRNYVVSSLLFILFSFSSQAQVSQSEYTDYHVHLQDSATVELGFRMLKAFHEVPKRTDSLVLNADTVIERLNRVKFKKARIISNAYWFGSPFTPIENEYEEVEKQNDWTAEQAARYPGRLVAFMSVNPLKPYALKEIQRCVKSGGFGGLKLHFANSKVNLLDKTQVLRLQKVFELANKSHLFLLVHFRDKENWNGKANAEIFLNHLLPFTKETKIVIAHMGGWGKFDKSTDEALKVFAAYINKVDTKINNLYFEVSAVVPSTKGEKQKVNSKENRDGFILLNKRIKEIGTDRILFGTDWPLMDIDPYIKLLESTLGTAIVRKILENKIGEN